MLPVISPQEAFERFSKGEARLVDIRETDEYTQEFVPGSRLIPLSIIAKHPLKDADAPDKPIVFFCHSGNRTANASDLLERLAGDVQAYRLDGGISGWEKAGLPVEHISSTIPLFRQIQSAAGSLVLIGVIGSAFWQPFFWLSAFVGAGLVFAGISGFCGLGVLDNGMLGASFDTPQFGIRAQIQHLKAYANKQPLNNACIDPRFGLVTRGAAPNVQYLGIQENPQGYGWAAGADYGVKILNILENILTC